MEIPMQGKIWMRSLMWALLCASTLHAQSASSSSPSPSPSTSTPRPVIVVNTFTAASNVAWPYDMKQMQNFLVAELKSKLGTRFDIVTEAPAEGGRVYKLDGEVTGWRPGNRAKRLLVGMGSGRESADIRYWLTDDKAKTFAEHKDTIRAEFWGNAYAGSVGELAHPFGSKVAKRLESVKFD
jgi:hypothetical protein